MNMADSLLGADIKSTPQNMKEVHAYEVVIKKNIIYSLDTNNPNIPKERATKGLYDKFASL